MIPTGPVVTRSGVVSSDSPTTDSATAGPSGFAVVLGGTAIVYESAELIAETSPALPGVTDTATPPITGGGVTTATTDWPPPGLAVLFPSTAQAPVSSSPAASTGVMPMPERLVPSPTLASPSPPVILATANTKPAPATGVANRVLPELIAAVSVRQPVAAVLPIVNEREPASLGTLLETFAAGHLLAGIVAPGGTSVAAPRLDLAQAFPVPLPLSSPRFTQELGARLQWIAEQQGGSATLRIAPEGLGPIEIRLKLDGERVDLGFSAIQAETRQALVDALPKLREMLAQQGLQLGHADIGQRHGDHGSGEAGASLHRDHGDEGVEGRTSIFPNDLAVTPGIGRGQGLLDLYA